MINTRPTMQEIMINLVKDLKRRSTCQRRQQACVIVDQEYTKVLSNGYNGRAAGEEHGCDTNESGKCGCTHAEQNCLVKLDTYMNNLILICTQSPCAICARLIVNSRKIKKVMYFEEYRDPLGKNILKKLGIEIEQIQIIK